MGATKNRTSSPTGLLRIRIWRMSIRRTKSAIISWTGSFNEIHARQGKIWVQKPCYRIIMITYFCLLWQESWLYLHAIYEKSLIPHEGSYEMKKRTISSAYQTPPPKKKKWWSIKKTNIKNTTAIQNEKQLFNQTIFFGKTLLHAHIQYIYIVNAKY